MVRRVLERLRAEDPSRILYSVSCSTRPPREGERPSLDYVFVSEDEFDRMLAAGEFLEWAEVFGHRYGTRRQPIEEALAAGRDALLEIDVQGARQVRREFPQAILVFLVPPSREELERRLRARGTEDEETVARRLATADRELAEAGWFDHVVVNDDVDRATGEVEAIIAAHRRDGPR